MPASWYLSLPRWFSATAFNRAATASKGRSASRAASPSSRQAQPAIPASGWVVNPAMAWVPAGSPRLIRQAANSRHAGAASSRDAAGSRPSSTACWAESQARARAPASPRWRWMRASARNPSTISSSDPPFSMLCW